ncbi:DUF6138 family protein [Paenibacillus lautus]
MYLVFAERHGVSAETMPTLIKCMLHSTDSMKLKIQSAWKKIAAKVEG